jgi:hypothetical protein
MTRPAAGAATAGSDVVSLIRLGTNGGRHPIEAESDALQREIRDCLAGTTEEAVPRVLAAFATPDAGNLQALYVTLGRRTALAAMRADAPGGLATAVVDAFLFGIRLARQGLV